MRKLSILLLFAIYNIASSQTPPNEIVGSKTDFIYKLIVENPTRTLKIIGTTVDEAYGSNWLHDVKVQGGFLVLSKNEERRYWDVENAIMIRTIQTSEGLVIIINLADK